MSRRMLALAAISLVAVPALASAAIQERYVVGDTTWTSQPSASNSSSPTETVPVPAGFSRFDLGWQPPVVDINDNLLVTVMNFNPTRNSTSGQVTATVSTTVTDLTYPIVPVDSFPIYRQSHEPLLAINAAYYSLLSTLGTNDSITVAAYLDAGNQPFATTVPMVSFTILKTDPFGYTELATYADTTPFPSTAPFSLTMVMTETLSANAHPQFSQFFSIPAIPEPTTVALLGAAAPLLLARRRA